MTKSCRKDTLPLPLKGHGQFHLSPVQVEAEGTCGPLGLCLSIYAMEGAELEDISGSCQTLMNHILRFSSSKIIIRKSLILSCIKDRQNML